MQVFFVDGHVCFFDMQNNKRVVVGTSAAFNAELFHGIFRLPKPGRVDQSEGDAVQCEHSFHGVAGGAGDVAHNGTVVVEQCIEECRLAHVGPSDDGDGDTLFQCIAEPERVKQGGKLGLEG